MARKASDSKEKAAAGTRAARNARAAEAKAGDAKPKRTNSTKAQVSAPAATSTRAAKPAPKAPTPRRPAAGAAKPAVKDGTKEEAGKRSQFDRDSLATIRKRLTEQRAELQTQLTAIEESALGLTQSEMSGEVSYDEDYADAGSFTFEREKEFSIANNVSDLRDKIDRALHKIAEGSYGVCESCGKPIEGPRLKALPHVTLCLKCKKAEERR
jgi:RNA polymerase-binding protein DksA